MSSVLGNFKDKETVFNKKRKQKVSVNRPYPDIEHIVHLCIGLPPHPHPQKNNKKNT